MKTILFLIQKEFKQIFRNKGILPLIFVMPAVQMLILPLAADFEVKNINIAIVDNDRSATSRSLISKVAASPYFKIVHPEGNLTTGNSGNDKSETYKDGLNLVEQEAADLVMEIPVGFETSLTKEGRSGVFIAVNAINGAKANIGGSYLVSIIRETNEAIILDWMSSRPPSTYLTAPSAEPIPLYWYNQNMSYQTFMVPGLIAIFVTMIGGFLSAQNLVREKEIGTIEQINVTPIKKSYFLFGKLIPFWLLGYSSFIVGLLIARFVYGIVPTGSLTALFFFAMLYLFAVLGFGLLVSTFCNTEQQAMLISFFFMMIFILMGGLFTPIDSMPAWARAIAAFNPITYFIMVLRSVILKGGGWNDILKPSLVIIALGIVLNTLAIINYRKTN